MFKKIHSCDNRICIRCLPLFMVDWSRRQKERKRVQISYNATSHCGRLIPFLSMTWCKLLFVKLRSVVSSSPRKANARCKNVNLILILSFAQKLSFLHPLLHMHTRYTFTHAIVRTSLSFNLFLMSKIEVTTNWRNKPELIRRMTVDLRLFKKIYKPHF